MYLGQAYINMPQMRLNIIPSDSAGAVYLACKAVLLLLGSVFNIDSLSRVYHAFTHQLFTEQ